MHFRYMIALLLFLPLSMTLGTAEQPIIQDEAVLPSDDISLLQGETDHLDVGTGHESDLYYLEGAVIDLEKLLENDVELRQRYDSLSKEERRAFLEALASFNEVFQQAFQALLSEEAE